jgi:hypothetical protein
MQYSLNNICKGKSAWIILKAFNHNVVNFEFGQWMLYYVIQTTFEYHWISAFEEVHDEGYRSCR